MDEKNPKEIPVVPIEDLNEETCIPMPNIKDTDGASSNIAMEAKIEVHLNRDLQGGICREELKQAKTIEVNNKDAKGRLILADILVYPCEQGVDKVVDLAMLTGACVVALGNDIAGMFTPNDEMAEEIPKASKITREKFWRMPLEESY
eukprot:Gb_40105 [translate_table: standard]